VLCSISPSLGFVNDVVISSLEIFCKILISSIILECVFVETFITSFLIAVSRPRILAAAISST